MTIRPRRYSVVNQVPVSKHLQRDKGILTGEEQKGHKKEGRERRKEAGREGEREGERIERRKELANAVYYKPNFIFACLLSVVWFVWLFILSLLPIPPLPTPPHTTPAFALIGHFNPFLIVLV